MYLQLKVTLKEIKMFEPLLIIESFRKRILIRINKVLDEL